MTPEEALQLLARWTNQLRVDLLYAQRTIETLEARVQRLEHAARHRALDRRSRRLAQDRAA